MGGKKVDNSAQQQQMQAAAEARQKEELRQKRLTEGMTKINETFDGKAKMGTRTVNGAIPFDKLPQGYRLGTRSETIGDPNAGYWQDYGEVATGGGQRWVPTAQTRTFHQLFGPDGNMLGEADSLAALKAKGIQGSYQETYDTGQKEGGIGDAFFNQYGQSIKDYYQPEVDKQYQDARDKTTFALARSGTLQSTAANQSLADLVEQKTMNDALIASKADTAKGQLKQRTAQEKSALINQLYATENPDIAANEALNRVRTLQGASPEFNPIGDLFKIATIGAGNFYSSYSDPYNSVRGSGSGLPSSSGRKVG